MFCTHCGTKIETGSTACPHCGEPVLTPASKSRFPLWLRLLIATLIIGFITSFFLFFTESEPVKTVEDQLSALSHNQLTEAYYGFTSSEFQQATSLEKFKDYIQANPLLTKVKTTKILDSKVEGDLATLKVSLTTDTLNKLLAEYQLVKDEENWKIISFKFVSDTPTPSDIPLVSDPIVDQLHSFLKTNEIEKGWSQTTSKEFQKATPLAEFTKFIASNPILAHFKTARPLTVQEDTDKVKIITYVLEGGPSEDANDEAVEYILTKDAEGWKIHGLTVILSSPSPVEPSKTTPDLQ